MGRVIRRDSNWPYFQRWRPTIEHRSPPYWTRRPRRAKAPARVPRRPVRWRANCIIRRGITDFRPRDRLITESDQTSVLVCRAKMSLNICPLAKSVLETAVYIVRRCLVFTMYDLCCKTAIHFAWVESIKSDRCLCHQQIIYWYRNEGKMCYIYKPYE